MQKYRINTRHEECDCMDCGCPLFRGDSAYEHNNDVFCSKTCAKRSCELTQRQTQIADDVRLHVFNLLDCEPEIDGMSAGKVAADVETAFVKSLLAIELEETPNLIEE